MRRRNIRLLENDRLHEFLREHPELIDARWRFIERSGLNRPSSDLAFKVMTNELLRSLGNDKRVLARLRRTTERT